MRSTTRTFVPMSFQQNMDFTFLKFSGFVVTSVVLLICAPEVNTWSTNATDQQSSPKRPEMEHLQIGISQGESPLEKNPEEGELFEGDIAGMNPQQNSYKNVINDHAKKWLTTNISYVIDFAKFDAKGSKVIEDAFQEFVKYTCIRFKPLDNINDHDFLIITAFEGCWSFVGRRGGAQMISLQNPGCVHRGIVVHELMHALGVWHEQSRHDRDDYIVINWDNIAPKHRHNFQKRSSNDSQTFDLNYDYGSIMHYSAYSFALNRTVPTLMAKRKDVGELGQRKGLSASDRAKINRLYDCS